MNKFLLTALALPGTALALVPMGSFSEMAELFLKAAEATR